ncbi:MAG: hypothetical protein KF778_02825 [Rhodocyclaceae bacterium]|nr:hypothetical protein [Rhodocyclaceae bacterium]MBX3667311.1 hypothetical protein [Rhodocyclaceae bacterium]
MTRKIELSQSQIDAIRQANEKTCGSISVPAPITKKTSFVFFAAFDGTNNDKDAVPKNCLSTNVGQLWDQYEAARGRSARLGGAYYKGVGTPGSLTASGWLPERVSEQTVDTAEQAYADLCVQAAKIRKLEAVAVVLTSFSRGGASAAIFAQLLYQLGIRHPVTKDTLVAPKNVPVVGGVIFDPVMTGVKCMLAYPPNVSNLVDLKAINEYRYLFEGADYSNHPEGIIKTYALYGNHCDVGGSYDNGLAGLSLRTATKVLSDLGLPIAPVPPQRAYDPDRIAVHTEQFDNFGNKIWSVYNEDGFSFRDMRLMKSVGVPATPDLFGKIRFLMYDGTVVS